ncbi:MAG: hypothetical protein J6D11_02305 [Clostridia bacterium]|nr:hypothetical protein [Clostridia bacterium]
MIKNSKKLLPCFLAFFMILLTFSLTSCGEKEIVPDYSKIDIGISSYMYREPRHHEHLVEYLTEYVDYVREYEDRIQVSISGEELSEDYFDGFPNVIRDKKSNYWVFYVLLSDIDEAGVEVFAEYLEKLSANQSIKGISLYYILALDE